ncbi:MAG: SRPBCC family protein [Bacteroidetes bacterium]|nr:SRPBCC family protein [Bacteroidota bacterium]
MMKDSKVETSHDFKLPAAAVWNLIAGFHTLPDYHTSVPESRLSHGGAVRYLTISEEAGGGTVVERLVNYDDEAMTFSYKIIELIDSPMPFRNYQAWVRLEPTGEKSCRLFWSMNNLHIIALWVQDSNQADYPLGVFKFDFTRLGVD